MPDLITIVFPKAEKAPVVLGYISVQFVLKNPTAGASNQRGCLSTSILQLLGRIIKKVDRAKLEHDLFCYWHLQPFVWAEGGKRWLMMNSSSLVVGQLQRVLSLVYHCLFFLCRATEKLEALCRIGLLMFHPLNVWKVQWFLNSFVPLCRLISKVYWPTDKCTASRTGNSKIDIHSFMLCGHVPIKLKS